MLIECINCLTLKIFSLFLCPDPSGLSRSKLIVRKSKQSKSTEKQQFIGANSKSDLVQQQTESTACPKKVNMENTHKKVNVLTIDVSERNSQLNVDDKTGIF